MNSYDATLNVKNGFPVFSTLVEVRVTHILWRHMQLWCCLYRAARRQICACLSSSS